MKNKVFYMILVLFTILYISPASAKIFTDDYMKSAFGSDIDFNELVELNNLLGPHNILFCRSEMTNEQCLLQVEGHRFVVDLTTFQFRRIGYGFDTYNNRMVAENFKALTAVEEKFVTHVQDKLSRLSTSNEFESIQQNIKKKYDLTSAPLRPISSSDYSYGVEFFAGPVCGSDGSAPFVPDHPFVDACFVHDNCYSTYTPRSVCDSRFHDHMLLIAQDISGFRGNLIIEHFSQSFLEYSALAVMATTYFTVVNQVGLTAYCRDKEDNEYCEEIDGEYAAHNTGQSGPWGTGTGQPPGNNTGTGGPGGSNPGSGDSGEAPSGPNPISSGCYIQVHWQVCTGGGCSDYVTFEPC